VVSALVALSLPIALVGLVSLLFSLFSVRLYGWGILGIYSLGVLFIPFLAIRFGTKQFFQGFFRVAIENIFIDET
jgi:hypothetical protein